MLPHRPGQDVRERRLEEPLEPPPRDLHRGRDGQARLDEPVVAERRPQLERVRHAHPVRHDEEVVGQVGREVDAEGPVQRVAVAVGLERAPLRRVHGGRQQRAERGRREPRQLLVAEEARPAQVALGQRRLGPRGEAAHPAAQVPAGARLANQGLRERARRAARRAREPRVELGDADAQVARVAAEGLVAADAREGDLHESRRRLGDRERRHRGGVGERLVEVADDRGQELGDVRLQDLLVVVGAEALGDEPRVGQLVVRGEGAREADRDGRDAPARDLPHARHDRARIDAARQEDAERHVALEPQPDRVA